MSIYGHGAPAALSSEKTLIINKINVGFLQNAAKCKCYDISPDKCIPSLKNRILVYSRTFNSEEHNEIFYLHP